jgi:acyl-ACP thioesterase
MKNTYSFTYTIRPHEANFLDKALPHVLLNYLQDAAYGHANELGVSVFHLFEKGLTWVLSRYHIAVDKYPVVGEEVKVRTWVPSPPKRFYLREFEIVGESGDVLVRASSSWLLADIRTKQAVHGDISLGEFPVVPRRAVEDDFGHLPAMEEHNQEERFCVRIGDLDLNRHVNHVVYIQWALESVPKEVLAKCRPVDIEVAYRGEAKKGEIVLARTQALDVENRFLHQLVRESDGKELTRLRTEWR